jgi:cyclohexa-1,5-dienecarbonyl-CoA hydratase
MPDLVTITPHDDGAIWQVTFGAAKGNVLDAATMAALTDAFARARDQAGLRAVCLEGTAPHFSFGASVAEHLPPQVADMLAAIRTLAMAMLDCRVPLIACLRGQCLGGGLEVATLCHRLIAHRSARLGQPEIALGAFAPIASVVLPTRLRGGGAEDLCLTGRSVTADEAHALALVDEVTDTDPLEAGLTWARTHLVGKSAAALRLAVEAVRLPLRDRLTADLPRLEALYLTHLMATDDALEGLQAFLEKRTPEWRHR